MENCLFCKIINQEIPSKKIYEDDLVFVFLDINPNTNGDLLIIPKKHRTNILDVTEEELLHINKVIKEKILPLLQERLNIEGLTLINNNGLGQEVKHFHIHLTPRYQNDEMKLMTNKNSLLDIEEIYQKLM